MVETETSELAQEERLFSAERLVFFSDAVVAIAITLLALELPVPPGDRTNDALLSAFRDNWPEYLAFGISFLVIARTWTGHHHLFGYVRSLAPGLMRWNLCWLFIVVVTPFVTKVLTGEGAFELRFALYAVTQALSSVFFALIVWSVDKGGVLKENTPPHLVRDSYRRLLWFAIGFTVSIPFAFVTHWAYAFWGLVPLFGGAVGRRIRQRRASTAAADSLG